MTPEIYMKRFHSETDELEGECCPLRAEDVYPCPPTQPEDQCPCQSPEEEPDREEDCCCKASMAQALHLLCGESLASLVDFDSFFFLTDSLAVGSPLLTPGAAADNISSPAASLRRFSPGNCDLLDVMASAYFNAPSTGAVALEEIEQLSLCAVKAAAFQITPSTCDDECADTNYRRALRAIRHAIQADGGSTGACGSCGAHCDCDDCCCAAGLLRELSSRNLSRQATLIAGPLVLQNVSVLGSVGSALILADEALSRIYLVCVNAVEALG